MHELVIVVFYFYMVRIGHSVFYFYMVRNGHSVILFPNWLLSKQCMVRNGYGAKYIKKMVRNGFWLWYEIAILWYEMVNYGTKWFLVMVRNCNFVVRNGKLWYEMAMVRNGYGTK